MTLDAYAAFFSQRKIDFPSEYVIRMFKGRYPRLHLAEWLRPGMRICDVGCGDGRNLAFLGTLDLDLSGVETSETTVEKVKTNIQSVGLKADIRVGENARLPFPDASFDILLSWNAGYYMGSDPRFESHVAEFSRVLRPGGRLILSVPKSSAFIFEDALEVSPGYREIRKDPFGLRQGTVMRCFSGENDIQEAFSPSFTDFVFGSIHDDCFGYKYHWHLAAATRQWP